MKSQLSKVVADANKIGSKSEFPETFFKKIIVSNTVLTKRKNSSCDRENFWHPQTTYF